MSSRPTPSTKFASLDKRSKILIGVLAVVLLIAAGWFLLKPGSSASSGATAGVPKPAATATKAVTPTPAPTAAPAAISNSTRDPFVPLAQEAVASASASPTSTATAAPSATATPTPAG
jgi:hypothetical protein